MPEAEKNPIFEMCPSLIAHPETCANPFFATVERDGIDDAPWKTPADTLTNRDALPPAPHLRECDISPLGILAPSDTPKASTKIWTESHRIGKRQQILPNCALSILCLPVGVRRAVSMAGAQGSTPRGIRIGSVFTPRGFRGCGDSTSLVATLSQQPLGLGRQFCFLYTDLANPTSNLILPKIGYQPGCECCDIFWMRLWLLDSHLWFQLQCGCCKVTA